MSKKFDKDDDTYDGRRESTGEIERLGRLAQETRAKLACENRDRQHEDTVRTCADTIRTLSSSLRLEELPDDWPVVITAGEYRELMARCGETEEAAT